jgi:copper transport protein
VAGARHQAAAEIVKHIVVSLCTALLLAAGIATGASAHAVLISVTPADGSVLAVQPAAVELRFNEPVTAGAVTLIDARGRTRDDARVNAARETISIALPAGLPQGSQVVSYRVISGDGHPVAGSMVFSIGTPSATAVPTSGDPVRDGLIWLARIGLYLGLFAGVGGVFFLCWIAQVASAQDTVLGALVLGLVAAVASLGLLGLDLLGLPTSALFTAAPWRVVAGTGFTVSVLIAGAGMIVGIVALQISNEVVARALAAVALACAGLTLTASGHAATASPALLARAAIFMHGTAIAFWLGALMPLAILVGHAKGGALPALNMFSRIAVPVVALLALSGVALSIVELETPSALVETGYGVVLLVKLVLVTGLLTLAALNRMRLVPALAADGGASRPLRRSILLECATALAVLGVVALWRFTPPPRSVLPETPLAVHIHSDKAMFQVLISPGKAGQDDFVLQLMNGDGSSFHAKEARLTLSLPGRGVADMEHQASLGSDGYWHVRKVPLPLPGHWHRRIDALVSDFDQISLEDDVDIAPR